MDGNTILSRAQKHPILLQKGHLVDLITTDIHLTNEHSGIALTERFIRDEYWIPSVKSRVKKTIRACTTCIRWRGQTNQPQMADLPPERVNTAQTFENTGVDLCGPFNVRASKLKFERIVKVWIAVFVCLSTKAVHLEICTDLSKENFLACFTRFTSRRGCPRKMFSDNGTNFKASSKEFKTGWKEGLTQAQQN